MAGLFGGMFSDNTQTQQFEQPQFSAPSQTMQPAQNTMFGGMFSNNNALQNDYNKYWSTVGAGQTVNAGGGTVTRNQDGSATWSNGTNSYNYNQNTPLDQVAANTGLWKDWGNAYLRPTESNGSQQIQQQAAPFTDFNSYQQWENSLGMQHGGAGYQAPDWLKMGGLSFNSGAGNSEAAKRWAFFQANPQYAQDWANIRSGQNSQYATDGSTLFKTDMNSLSPQAQAYYGANPNQLSVAEGFNLDPTLYSQRMTGGLDLGKTTNYAQYMQNNKWTPNGVVANNNIVSNAGKQYIGADGKGGDNYWLPRYDPNTGNIVNIDGTISDPYSGQVYGKASPGMMKSLYGTATPGRTGATPQASASQSGSSGYGFAPSSNRNTGLGLSSTQSEGGSSVAASNPNMSDMEASITKQMNDNLNRNVLPKLRSSAQAVGGFGGSRQGVVEANALKDMNSGLSDALANLRYNDYNAAQNRALQQQQLDNSYALGLQNLGLGYYNAGNNFYTSQRGQDLSQLALGSQLYNAGAQGMLGSGQGIYNIGTTTQQAPWSIYGNFAGLSSPYTGFGSSTANTSANPWASALGGAIGGAQLFNLFK